MNLVERLRKEAGMSDQEWQPKLRALLLDAASHIESQDKRIRELEGALRAAKGWLEGWASAEPFLSIIRAALRGE